MPDVKPDRADSELRGTARRLVALRGSLSDEGRSFAVPCIIRDASKEGFKVYCLQECHLPGRVLLTHDRLNAPIRAKVKWRDGKWVGLQIAWDDAGEDPVPGA